MLKQGQTHSRVSWKSVEQAQLDVNQGTFWQWIPESAVCVCVCVLNPTFVQMLLTSYWICVVAVLAAQPRQCSARGRQGLRQDTHTHIGYTTNKLVKWQLSPVQPVSKISPDLTNWAYHDWYEEKKNKVSWMSLAWLSTVMNGCGVDEQSFRAVPFFFSFFFRVGLPSKLIEA